MKIEVDRIKASFLESTKDKQRLESKCESLELSNKTVIAQLQESDSKKLRLAIDSDRLKATLLELHRTQAKTSKDKKSLELDVQELAQAHSQLQQLHAEVSCSHVATSGQLKGLEMQRLISNRKNDELVFQLKHKTNEVEDLHVALGSLEQMHASLQRESTELREIINRCNAELKDMEIALAHRDARVGDHRPSIGASDSGVIRFCR